MKKGEKNMKKEQLQNLLQGLEVEANQPIMQKYLSNYVLVKVWNKTMNIVNGRYHRNFSSNMYSVENLVRITLAAIKNLDKDLDIELALQNSIDYPARKDMELLVEGLRQIYLENYEGLLKIVSVMLNRLNMKDYDNFYLINPFGMMPGDEILSDYTFIQTAGNDIYQAVANDTVINQLNSFESFLDLDFDNKMLIMDIVVEEGYVTDFAFDLLSDEALENVGCYETIMVQDFNIKVEKDKLKKDVEGRYTLLELFGKDVDISRNLYKAYFIGELNWNYESEPVCFDEFLNNELKSDEYAENYIIGNLI